MERRQRQCTKFDIFGFCIDEHPNHWKYGGGTHGRPRPAPRPDKPRPTPQPPLPDRPKRGDKPDKPDKPDRPGRKLTKKEREDLAITYRKLPNRPSSEMTPADVEAAHLHEAARQFEFDPSGESTNQYLRESGVEWTHLPEVSRGETGYNKGSVFQSNDGTKLRVVYTGTDTAKPSDIVADAQVPAGSGSGACVCHMEYGGVLNAASFADLDGIDVAANHCHRPDRAVLPDLDVADNACRGIDVYSFPEHWSSAGMVSDVTHRKHL